MNNAGLGGHLQAIAQGATLGAGDEIEALAAAGETGVHNLLSKTGLVKGSGYSAPEAYQAVMQAAREQRDGFAKDHPVQNIAENIVGGLATPGAALAGKFVGGAKSLGGAALRSAGLGGAIGTVAGFNSGYGLDGRLEGAVNGAGWGLGLGAAAPVAGLVLGAGKNAIIEGADGLARKMGRKGWDLSDMLAEQAQIASARQDAKVAGALGKSIKNSGKTVEDVVAAAKANRQYPAYVQGGNGMTSIAEILGQTPGPGETIVQNAAMKSLGSGPGRLKAELASRMGANGEYFGTLDALKKNRAAQVGPMIKDAFDQPIDGDVFGSQFEPLLARMPRGALAHAYDLARIDGRNPEELGLRITDPFGGFDAGTSKNMAVPIDRADYARARGSSTPSLKQGPTLMEFIGKRGGIKNDGGEVRALDGDIWHKDKPFKNMMLKANGLSLENHATAAHEAGYFPDYHSAWDSADNTHPVTPEDLLNAIKNELDGKPIYAVAPDSVAFGQRARADSLRDRLDNAGINPHFNSPESAGQILGQHEAEYSRILAHQNGSSPVPAQSEFLSTTNPTLETLHYVKRGLDKELERYRNPVTLKLDQSMQGVPELSNLRAQLAGRMRDANGSYNQAMQIHGDESDHINALNLGRNVFSNKLDNGSEQVANVVSGMSDTSRDMYRKGIAEAALTEVRSKGFGAVRRLMNDEFGAKVKLAFRNQDDFGSFMDALEQESKVHNINQKIVGGSPTYHRQAARADLEEQSPDILDHAADVVDTGLSPVRLTGKILKQALKSLPRTDRSIIGDQELNAIASNAVVSADDLERVMGRLGGAQRQKMLMDHIRTLNIGLAPTVYNAAGLRQGKAQGQ